MSGNAYSVKRNTLSNFHYRAYAKHYQIGNVLARGKMKRPSKNRGQKLVPCIRLFAEINGTKKSKKIELSRVAVPKKRGMGSALTTERAPRLASLPPDPRFHPLMLGWINSSISYAYKICQGPVSPSWFDE